MALLAGLAQQAATAASWELSQLAAAAGLPQPPPITLPPLPTGPPDPAALVALIGQPVASLLAAYLSDPALLGQLQADLAAAQARVDSYVNALTTLESRLLAELAGVSAELTALQAAVTQAAGPLNALGEDGPSPALLAEIATLAPDLAALLTTLQTGQSDAARRLTAAQASVTALQAQLTQLAALKTAAQGVAAELAGRLAGLAELFSSSMEVLT